MRFLLVLASAAGSLVLYELIAQLLHRGNRQDNDLHAEARRDRLRRLNIRGDVE